MHKKKAWLPWLTRRDYGHLMMNSMSIHLLMSMMYVHVFLFRMNIIIMYVPWLGEKCNLLMSWHEGAFLYRDVNNAPIFFMNMRGGIKHWVDVSIGNAIYYIHLYFKKRIGPYMTAALYTMFSYAKGHVLGLCHEKISLTREHSEQGMCFWNHV